MTAALDPQDIHFILVRPNFLGNIGAVARLCKNFGFRNLRLVDAPRNYKDGEARKMAVGAFDVLKTAKTFSTLSEALADINLAVGTTAGQQRTQPLVTLSTTLRKIRASSGNKIAIVFGDERDGLTNKEISLCHILACIETDKDFPSMNVSQAVGVIAYELFRACSNTSQPSPESESESQSHSRTESESQSESQSQSRTESESQSESKSESALLQDSRSDRQSQIRFSQKPLANLLPTGKSDDELFQLIEILLENIQFSRSYNKEVVTKELRRLYYKAGPTKRESDLLRGVLHKLNQALARRDLNTDVDEG